MAICEDCGRQCKERCLSLNMLYNIYNEHGTVEKIELIKALRKELNILDVEVADDLKILGDKVIKIRPELGYITENEIKIGYVRSYETKSGRKITFADCRKVSGPYIAYLPYDFIITFYDNEAGLLTDNQQKILMLHELKHIEIGERGFSVRPHDIEDFRSILEKYGINWNEINQDVPDILAGG